MNRRTAIVKKETIEWWKIDLFCRSEGICSLVVVHFGAFEPTAAL
jgi:hypothetical protein